MAYKTEFTIDGLDFRLTVADDGQITFFVIGGATKKKAFDPTWYDDVTEYSMRDRDYFDNAWKVFSVIKKKLLAYIGKKKPFMLYFKASTDRKHKVYQKLAAKLAMLMKDKYMFYEQDKVFYFVKRGA